MTRKKPRRTARLARALAVCTLASTTLASVAHAQNPAAGGQTVAAATTVETIADQVAPDVGLPPESIRLGPLSLDGADALHVIDRLTESRLLPAGELAVEPIFAGFDAYGRPRFAQPQIADLEAVCVRTVDPGSPAAGPIYGVTIRNCGDAASGRFRLALVAGLGGIDELSPTACTTLESLAPGECVRVELQLPLRALSMRDSATIRPFDTLVLAVDILDQIPESNERNNLLALNREAILPLEAAVVGETVVASGAPAAVGGAVPVVPDGNAVPPSMRSGEAEPGESEAPAPPQIDENLLDGFSNEPAEEEMRSLFR